MKTRLSLSILLIALLAWPALAGPPLGRPGPASHDAIGVAGQTQAASDAVQPVYLDRGVVSDAYLYGADRLEALQNNDGGWDWPLDDGNPNNVSPRNTIGPIGKGLARAYLHTQDAAHLAAIGQAGALLLTKVYNFSPSDGYLAAQLDDIFDVTTYVNHVTANFYSPLADSTYNRNGAGTLYDTASYVQLIRDSRTGSQANLAAWDIGMGLVGALAADANPADWIAGVEAEINELNGAGWYDVIGLAGALYGLAAAGVEFDPSAGEHIAATNLADLAVILAGYQIAGGGFAWNSDYVIPNDGNETIQETAYAILALEAVNSTTYAASINGASLYMLGVQLATGGWENYPASGENNEITAEALWGIDAAGTEITEVWVDDDFNSSTPGWGVTHFASIQDGIDAVSGSTVNVAAGTYVQSAQLYIDGNLTLIGAGIGLTVVMPGFNTAVGGNVPAEALIYVAPGATVTIEDITVDGTGYTVNHAIQSRGASLTVRDCEIRDIYAGTYNGRGIVFYAGTGLVQNCVMSSIQRIGVHIRGNVEFPAPAVTVDGLNYTGKGAGDWLDYGVEFGGGGGGAVMNSVITACRGVAYDGSDSAGILVTDYYGTGTTAAITASNLSGNSTGVNVGYAPGDLSVVSVHGCDLSGSTDYGVYSIGPSVDALGNWWGHATGPHHPTTNPLGLGVEVSDNVLFDPWTGLATLSITPDPSGPISCSQESTLSFIYTPDAMTPQLRGYTIRVTATSQVSFTASDIDVNDELVLDSDEMVQIVQNGANDYTIDWAVLGGSTGVSGVASFFDITFHGASTGAATVSFVSCLLRDLTNGPVGVDCSDTASIEVDCLAPGAVTDLSATTGHEKVTLDWSISGVGETAALEVWRAVWHQGAGFETVSAYPEYDDLANDAEPTVPASRAAAVASAEWGPLPVATLPSGTVTYVDNVVARGIYYYVVIPIDLAANPGPPSSMVRAKNYHLGDVQVAWDGDVDTGDVTVLGAAYGSVHAGPGYNNHCDVGPTTNALGTGFPLTDNIIGFEDLMIFALNYGNVGPAPVVQGSDIAMLSWFEMEDGVWGLGLTEPCANLKALQLKAALPAGAEVQLTSGSLLSQQAGPIFLRQIPGEGLDVSLAVLGEGLVISGQGLLFSVTLPAGVLPGDIELTVRDAANAELAFALGATAVEDLPTVYRLAGNFPNPFNPKTTISFDLPEAQFVRLAVFSADGRRIAMLLSQQLAAGSHSASWDGRDEHGDQVASGVYFARIEAGPLNETHKMLLMK